MIKYALLIIALLAIGCKNTHNNEETSYIDPNAIKEKNILLKIRLTRCMLSKSGVEMDNIQKKEIISKVRNGKQDIDTLISENTELTKKISECKSDTNLDHDTLSTNNMGMWKINYFVDKFNQLTKDKYITNKDLIVGTFSNSATQDSKLNVRFIIQAENLIGIILYEYGGTNPVKSYYDATYYNVYAKDKYGKTYKFLARNINTTVQIMTRFIITAHLGSSDGKDFSDVLIFNQLLLNEGTIYFHIEREDHGAVYDFKIDGNLNLYKNAFSELLK